MRWHGLRILVWARGREDVDDEHLLALGDWIGPLPENLYQRWTRSSKYFTLERVLYNTIVSMDSWDFLGYEPYPLEDNRMDPMEKQFDEDKPTSVSPEEATVIKALIRRTLQYDPAKRPTACELLQDPWFTTHFERILTEEVFPYAANFTSLC
jgi:serine/threonine protein kinase